MRTTIRHHRSFFRLVLLSSFAPIACSGSIAEDTCVDESPLINGTTSSAADYPGVIKALALGRSCTTARVADRLLLTAAHCFEGLVAGDKVTLSRGQSEPSWSEPYTAQILTRHPSYGDPSIPWYEQFDVAIVQLTTAPASTVGITKVDTLPMTLGGSLTFVGYGCNQFEDDVGTGAGVRRHGIAAIEKLYTAIIQTNGPVFGCPGDSGGPAFRGTDSGRIVGVASTANYSRDGGATYSRHTRLENIDSWLRGLGVTMYNEPPEAGVPDASDNVDARADGSPDANLAPDSDVIDATTLGPSTTSPKDGGAPCKKAGTK